MTSPPILQKEGELWWKTTLVLPGVSAVMWLCSLNSLARSLTVTVKHALFAPCASSVC